MDSSRPVSQRAKISGDLVDKKDWTAAKLVRSPLILLYEMLSGRGFALFLFL